jgi:hypothetical protein
MLHATATALLPAVGEDAPVTVLRMPLKTGHADALAGGYAGFDESIEVRDNLHILVDVTRICLQAGLMITRSIAEPLRISGEASVDVLDARVRECLREGRL